MHLIGRRATAGLVVAIFAVPFLAGRAQEPRRLVQADSIPIELATSLISAGGLGGEPQILVGALPGWIANRLYIPSNARVLGAAFLNSSVVGVMSVPDAPEAIIADLKRELAKHGWTPPPPFPSYGGGFRPASQNQMTYNSTSPTNATFCGDQQVLTVSAVRRRGTTTQVTMRASPTSNQGVCNPPQPQAGMNRSPLPTLYNPPSAGDGRMAIDCSNGFSGSNGTGAILRVAMDPDALLSHYARQLQDSGWHASSERATIVGRSWTRPDSTGTPVDLTLMVTTSPRDSTCRELSLQLRTLRKP